MNINSRIETNIIRGPSVNMSGFRRGYWAIKIDNIPYWIYEGINAVQSLANQERDLQRAIRNTLLRNPSRIVEFNEYGVPASKMFGA